MIKLLNEKSKITAESILALLKDNGIKGYISMPDLGGYTHIISGQSIYGYDIYIDEADLECAREIIEFLQSEADEDTELSEDELAFEEEVQEMKNRKYHFRRTHGRIIVAVVIIIVIARFILNYYSG